MTRYLALRDHSRYELKQKLSSQFPPEVVAQVLTQAEARGFIGNEDEIAARAALAYQRRGKSRLYIEGQLRKRGLPVPPPDDDVELKTVRDLITRKFGDLTELTRDDYPKVVRFLKYRGFPDRLIRQVLYEKP